MKYEVAFAFEGLESSGLAVKYCFLRLFYDWITPLSSLSLTSFMDFIDCSTFLYLFYTTAHIPCPGSCLFLLLPGHGIYIYIYTHTYIYEVAYDFH